MKFELFILFEVMVNLRMSLKGTLWFERHSSGVFTDHHIILERKHKDGHLSLTFGSFKHGM